MKILLDILKDSKTHYLDVESRILKRLQAVQHGSVFKRRLSNGDYYYLNFREGGRVISKYVGKDEPVQLLKEIEERRLLIKRLKDVRQNLVILKRLRWEKHVPPKK